MSKPNILMFMSDQHSPYYSGYYGHNVDTPNLDHLAENGTVFNEAYTACPICVPSRTAMLTGKRPAETGVFNNSNAFSNLTPTFLHHLVLAGYETVLVGRMHFIGEDQRHGFTKRIAPDCTTISYIRDDKTKVRGVYETVYGGYKNTNLVGGGYSSSAYYDQMVIDIALDYLKQSHDKPQFIVVSIYSPHHPYVGPKDFYLKYKERVELPKTFRIKYEYDEWKSLYRDSVSEALGIDILAAYCAMIESVDKQIGDVYKAFVEYCQRQDRKRLFIYLSDHGDHVGDRRTYGKVTFYEKSCKIPLIMTGDNVAQNNMINNAVSIMDVGPTILEFVNAKEMKDIDGVSLASSLMQKPFNTHPVYAEQVYLKENSYAFMLKENQYKYITVTSSDKEQLFDTVNDPSELDNMIDKLPEVASRMRNMAKSKMKSEQAFKTFVVAERNRELWTSYEKVTGAFYNQDNAFKGPVPNRYLEEPEIKSENSTEL